MDKFSNLQITSVATSIFDFAHSGAVYYPALKTNLTEDAALNRIYAAGGALVTATNQEKINRNLQVVEDLLGLNGSIYNLTLARDSATSGLDANGIANHILTKKINRLLAFRDSVCNFCLEIIHQMYWVDFKRYKKQIYH